MKKFPLRHAQRLASILFAVAIIAASAPFAAPVNASGVVVTLTPGSSSVSPTDVGANWTRTSPTTYATGTTITLTVTPAITSVSSTSAIDLDHDGNDDANFTSSSTDGFVTTITFTVATTTASQTTFTATSTLSFVTTTPRNYSIAVFTSSPVDFGAALFAVNGGNQVTITATTPASLSFAIRNSGDSADTNACALGTLSTAAINTCSYRLRIATNAANGFQTTIQADHDFASGSATMTNIGDNAVFAAGTEAYGIQTLTGATTGGRNGGGTAYDQPVVENGGPVGFTFNTDASPVPTSTAPVIVSYTNSFNPGASPSTTSTSLIAHAAAINAGTPVGNYSQTVTYTVTATF